MSPLDLRRKKAELLRVSSSKATMDVRIHELLEEIDRLKEHIKVSEAAEVKLAEEIAQEEKK